MTPGFFTATTGIGGLPIVVSVSSMPRRCPGDVIRMVVVAVGSVDTAFVARGESSSVVVASSKFDTVDRRESRGVGASLFRVEVRRGGGCVC